jgi:hypothetical protein
MNYSLVITSLKYINTNYSLIVSLSKYINDILTDINYDDNKLIISINKNDINVTSLLIKFIKDINLFYFNHRSEHLFSDQWLKLFIELNDYAILNILLYNSCRNKKENSVKFLLSNYNGFHSITSFLQFTNETITRMIIDYEPNKLLCLEYAINFYDTCNIEYLLESGVKPSEELFLEIIQDNFILKIILDKIDIEISIEALNKVIISKDLDALETILDYDSKLVSKALDICNNEYINNWIKKNYFHSKNDLLNKKINDLIN